MQLSALRCSLVLVIATSSLAACNRRVFEHVDNVCYRTIVKEVEVPTEKAADILIVVDNSGSMAEEQQNLVDNFLNLDPGECPLQDLGAIADEYKNPVRALYTEGGTLARCGFIQLLAAFENDFRVGVITTDVGICDNRVGQAGAAWGYRPQRGCLQPDGPPGGSMRKVIAAADLRPDDPEGTSNDDFAQRFRSTLENIQTFGSPFERGLDAVDLFLDPESDRHQDCVGDLGMFRRDDAALVVIFLTDEEDCSHGRAGMLDDFGDENAGEVCGTNPYYSLPTDRCYTNPDQLSPVADYVDVLLGVDERAKVAVIAGGVGQPGSIEPTGCRVSAAGLPEGGDLDGDGDNDSCFQSGGMSNYAAAGQPCGPDTEDARGGLPCCVADPGARYYQLASLLGDAATDSICNASFRATMLDIAAFIAAVDQVTLAEPPASPSAIIVEITRAGSSTEEQVDPLPPGADCAAANGYQLVEERIIQLCGDARPGPGDTIHVAAAGQESEACTAAQ